MGLAHPAGYPVSTPIAVRSSSTAARSPMPRRWMPVACWDPIESRGAGRLPNLPRVGVHRDRALSCRPTAQPEQRYQAGLAHLRQRRQRSRRPPALPAWLPSWAPPPKAGRPGSGCRKVQLVLGWDLQQPAVGLGLARVATFARNLVLAIPTVITRPTSSSTLLAEPAGNVPPACPRPVPDPRHRGTPRRSRRVPRSRGVSPKTSNTASLALAYAEPGRDHDGLRDSRRAWAPPIAVRTPRPSPHN